MTNSLLSVCEGARSDHTEGENTIEEQTWKHSYFFKNFKWVCRSIFQIQSHAFFRTNHLKFQAIYTKTWVEFLRPELVLEKQKHKYLLSVVETPRKFIIAIINLRGVSTKLNKYMVFTMQTYKNISIVYIHKYAGAKPR